MHQQSSQARSEPVQGTTYNFIRDSNPTGPSGSIYQPPISTTAATNAPAPTPAEAATVNEQIAGLLACACCTGTVVLCCGVFVLALSCLSIAIAIAEIVIGNKYSDQCPAASDIPYTLYLVGILGLAPTVLSIVTVIATTCIPAEKKESKVVWLIDLILRAVSAIANLLLIVLLIYLIFITFSIYRKVQYTHPTATSTYCHKTLYRFTLFIAVLNIINTCFVCCCGSASPEKQKKKPETNV
jgi:hypothetical protein